MARELTENTSGLTIALHTTPEDLDPRKCFDDPEEVAYLIQGILERKPWIWFAAKVTASWEGISESACLGANSYESEEDFKAEAYQELVAEALKKLNQRVDMLRKVIARLDEE